MQIPFKNGKFARDYLVKYLPLGSGWKIEWLEIPGFPERLPVWFLDTSMWLSQQYGCKERGQGFVLRGDHFDRGDADACVEAFHGDLWQKEEAALLLTDPDAYMAALEFSSDGTAVNRKGLSLHPLYANLRNRPNEVQSLHLFFLFRALVSALNPVICLYQCR